MKILRGRIIHDESVGRKGGELKKRKKESGR